MKQIFLLLICLFGSWIGMAQSERSGPETWESFSDTARLQNSEVLLDEIHVSASRIQRKADRYVMQVSPDVNQDGMELLRQAPGVWISEGQVSINGSTGTKIYVNGREIRLEGELLIAGEKVAAVGPDLSCSFPGMETIDAEGMRCIPGYLDQHVHITGGGGEGGFANQVPPLKASVIPPSKASAISPAAPGRSAAPTGSRTQWTGC